MINITPTVRNLLIINVVAFLAFSYFGSSAPFALYGFRSQYFRPYQFFTYMFMHGNFGHLFSNMLSLFIFGPMLEYRWGAQRFLIFYLICGIGAGVLYTGVRTYEFGNMQQQMESFLVNPSPEALNAFLDEHLDGGYNKQAIVEYKRNANDPAIIAASKKAIKNIYESIINIPMVGASGRCLVFYWLLGCCSRIQNYFCYFFRFPLKPSILCCSTEPTSFTRG
nr:rhomboid family intramembrane serine protease [Adhaeribacter swui]